MASHISKTNGQRIEQLLFSSWGTTPQENFLRRELERYIPEFSKDDDQTISNFAQYQRAVYLDGQTPIIGRPLACLNPTFIDNANQLHLSHKGSPIWTVASKKENGYRMQLHLGEHLNQAHTTQPNASALTRQFTTYDLRLFPELHHTFQTLPVMIGDAELINANYEHLAGFNRVQKRLPNTQYWPAHNQTELDDIIITTYLKSNLFANGQPLEEYKLTLAFHSLFAIAEPSTWTKSKREQQASLVSLSAIPKNYKEIHKLLNELEEFIREEHLNARTVERTQIKRKKDLQIYIRRCQNQGLEGTCVAQWIEGPQGLNVAKTTKIKNYETIDAALLGLYLHDSTQVPIADNFQGALLGLYDTTLNQYLPAFKVNLDSNGPQIKTEGQRERLQGLRQELMQTIQNKEGNIQLTTLYNTYLFYAARQVASLCPALNLSIQETLMSLPRGHDFLGLYQTFTEDHTVFERVKKVKTKRDEFIQQHYDLFNTIKDCESTQPSKTKLVLEYIKHAKDIKTKSQGLAKPHIIIDTTHPIILEGQVFDIKYNLNPCPAGFDPHHLQSFHLTNVFAERIRYDKATTTDYGTIHTLAIKNTVK